MSDQISIPSPVSTHPETQPKTLHYNEAVEQALLGCILLDNDCFDDLVDLLNKDYFYFSVHQKLYQLMVRLLGQGRKVDYLVLKPILQKDPEFQPLLEEDYLNTLVASVPVLSNAKEYASMVRDLYIKRVLSIIYSTQAGMLPNYETSQDAVDAAEAEIFQLAEKFYNQGNVATMYAEVITEVLEQAKAAKKRGGISGVKTSFIDFDKSLGGLHNSDLIILAGRPSMGKTALATNMAYNVASEEGPVLLFSLEMSKEQIVSRIISAELGIHGSALQGGTIKDEDIKRIAALQAHALNKKLIELFIEDSSFLNVVKLRSIARRFKRLHGLKLIVIDYLQLLTSAKRNENRVAEISEITRHLKAIAKELDVPILALSQLSRAVEGREDKRPALSDLRESGSIEQDADIVCFVYREEYYVQREEPMVPISNPNATLAEIEAAKAQHPAWLDWKAKLDKVKGLANVIVAKNRRGAVSNIQLLFDPERVQFKSFASHFPTSSAPHTIRGHNMRAPAAINAAAPQAQVRPPAVTRPEQLAASKLSPSNQS